MGGFVTTLGHERGRRGRQDVGGRGRNVVGHVLKGRGNDVGAAVDHGHSSGSNRGNVGHHTDIAPRNDGSRWGADKRLPECCTI